MPTNSLYWERAQPAEFINHCYDDKVIDALEAYFGTFPIILTQEHLPILRSWSMIGGGRPLRELISAVEKNGEIRVWWDGRHWRRVQERERLALRPRTSFQPHEEIPEDNPYNEFAGLEQIEAIEDETLKARGEWAPSWNPV
jgi:hypothetical protein